MDAADSAGVAALAAVMNAVRSADSPWEHPDTPHRLAMNIRHGWDGDPGAYHLAWDPQVGPVGYLVVFTSSYDNPDLAWQWLAIAPEHRRRGHGTTLVAQAAEVCRGLGRTLLGADGWDSDRTRRFAGTVGFEQRSQAICRRQFPRELTADQIDGWQAEARAHAGGYELERWVGYSPADMLAPLADLTAAINDSPIDDLEVEDEVYTPERVLAYERAQLEGGFRLRRIVARERCTGALAGHTVVTVDEERPDPRPPARHGGRPRPPGTSPGTAPQGRDAPVAARRGAPAGDDRHVQRRVQLPHGERERAARLPGDGPGAGVPAPDLRP